MQGDGCSRRLPADVSRFCLMQDLTSLKSAAGIGSLLDVHLVSREYCRLHNACTNWWCASSMQP